MLPELNLGKLMRKAHPGQKDNQSYWLGNDKWLMFPSGDVLTSAQRHERIYGPEGICAPLPENKNRILGKL